MKSKVLLLFSQVLAFQGLQVARTGVDFGELEEVVERPRAAAHVARGHSRVRGHQDAVKAGVPQVLQHDLNMSFDIIGKQLAELHQLIVQHFLPSRPRIKHHRRPHRRLHGHFATFEVLSRVVSTNYYTIYKYQIAAAATYLFLSTQ